MEMTAPSAAHQSESGHDGRASPGSGPGHDRRSRRPQIEPSTHTVLTRLRERIVTGEIPPDTRLRAEGLAAEMNVSRTPIRSALAVLSAEAMDDMMTKDPQLAASLIALLARKLSLRLRVVSARLSDNQK